MILPTGPVMAEPRPAERGFPLIQTYVPNVPEAETQSFGIARDPRGVLYVANNGGLLIYDGAWWRGVRIGKAKAAFSVAANARGEVAVGGHDDLGVMAADEQGSLRFVSLLDRLPPAQRALGQVMATIGLAQGFLFSTARWVLAWDGSRFTTIATFPGDRPYARPFAVAGEAYVWSREGLFRLTGTRLAPVPGGDAFRGRRVDTILPADPGLLVSVRGEGLFLFAGGKAVPFAPAASRWTAEKRLFDGCRLADGRWALGSILGGLLLLRPDGAIDQVIDTTVGLRDDFVYGLTVDREGALWLALNNGLARVEVASPLSVIDRRSGLQGSVLALARWRGRFWIGTASGLFTIDGGTARPTDEGAEADRPARVRQVPGLPPAVWSLLTVEGDLLVGTAFGLYRLPAEGAAELVPGTEQHTIYALARSTAHPERIWVGMADGLATARREGTGWRFAGTVAGVTSEVRTLVEGGQGALWCGTSVDGVLRVEAGGPGAARARRVPDSGEAVLAGIGGRILAIHEGKLLRLDEARAELVEDPALAAVGSHEEFSSLAEDAEGNLWLGTLPPAVALRRGGGWGPEVRSLVEVPARSDELIVAEPDGVVWLATELGLFRYAGSLRSHAAPLPAPLFARIAAGGALLFGGAPGAAPAPAELPPNVRHLRIELGPFSCRAGLRYQTRLDPIDAEWGAPTAEPFAELTRLPPGRYTFRARTVGANGEMGPAAAWSFRVRTPWYEAKWALGLWGLAVLLLAIGYSRLRSRALRQRAARLESRVAEQTLELRHTVDELSRAHAELEVANERLEALTLQDELTGIANRRRLQQVLDEEWSRACRHQVPLGFILLDLDHFKLLNDTRGHQEGDACLQAVARHLAASMRRTGDLVARYGGEELAVLLPETDLAGAERLAEDLRQGIENLALPHPAVAAGHITASFGVASLVPAPGQPAEALVEAADLALYRAKTAGRNRVWVEVDTDVWPYPGNTTTRR